MYFNPTQIIQLARSLITKTSPAYVQYYLTARCDLACQQCNIVHAQADAPEMNLAQIRQMARNLADIGVCIVLFIGGEPFIREDLPEIVKAFTDVNIHVRLQTNGLASTEALKKCVAAGAHDISISLDTLDGALQDSINAGHRGSWERALETIAKVNRIFPKNGSGFLGTVIMPQNIEHIQGIIKFATRIGWWVSLVPVHLSTPDNPRGFRQFDTDGRCTFASDQMPLVEKVLRSVKDMRKNGYNVYDSDEYLDDVLRFIKGDPVQWRRRNNGVCDSPNLYFAIEPDGSLGPCCDYKLEKKIACYDPEFPMKYWRGDIHKEVLPYTRECSGCMYGSYPEISVSARYWIPQLTRFFFFNFRTKNLLRDYTAEEMQAIARQILTEDTPSDH